MDGAQMPKVNGAKFYALVYTYELRDLERNYTTCFSQ